jgi:glycosyltransferase involved in cell wall biosynthesis
LDISIIIPTSGRCEILNRALNSLRESIPFGRSVEVIVVCNPCNINVKETVERFRYCDIPVKYVGSNKVGTNRARNLGVEHSRGRNLLFLDDDVQIPHFQFWAGFWRLDFESISEVAAGGYYLNRPEAKISEIIYNAAAGLWLMKSRAGGMSGVLCFLVAASSLDGSYFREREGLRKLRKMRRRRIDCANG